ncbi:MAG TPA: hypothetical protein VNH19_00110 [Candidatus Limnocylindrales bacterium]|nr:hypothetical protein [Candidatus Limnocylindrales bacterium]
MEFVIWMWHKASVPLFIERFVLPVFAGIVILVAVTNPMRFDVIQRISGTILLISAALFISQTWYKRTVSANPPAASQQPSGQNSGDQPSSKQNSSPSQNSPTSPPQKPPASPPVSQNSKGQNSPNVNVGGNNNTTTVTINSAAPQTQPPKLKFKNVTDIVTFSFGENGMSFPTSIERLRNPLPWTPMVMRNGPAFSFYMSGETLLVDATIGAGGQFGPIIEVRGNRFAVRDPHFDSNSNENALEVVAPDGQPIFQLIQKSPTHVVINGFFPADNGQSLWIAGPDGVQSVRMDADLPKLRLRPIFKYPAWKYPGQYAD